MSKVTRTIPILDAEVTSFLGSGDTVIDTFRFVGETDAKTVEKKILKEKKEYGVKAVIVKPLDLTYHTYAIDMEDMVKYGTEIEKKEEE